MNSNSNEDLKDCFHKTLDHLRAIRYKTIEDVRSRVGKDNQFTVSCTLSGLPGKENFASTFKEALIILGYTEIIVVQNNWISYELSTEYAYSPSSGYPLVLSEGCYIDHSDFKFVLFYFGSKSVTKQS